MATSAASLLPVALPKRYARNRAGSVRSSPFACNWNAKTCSQSSKRSPFVMGATPTSRLLPHGYAPLSNVVTYTNRSFRNWRRRKMNNNLSPIMEWQDCSAEMEIDVPCSVAYECYSDRESIPLWMPFISSVKVLNEKPDLSRWSLNYEILGQNVEFSWLARNLQPIRNQKIHWRSLEGLPNRGTVRFYPRGSSACKIELTVSYEVPQILTPVASALKPFLQDLLLQGLKKFVTVAKGYQNKISS